MLRLILISIAGTMIYGLPYFRSYYYDAYLQTYGLTNSQMGMFGSIFGIMGACSYLFGGVVADMFSARKLMTLSMILTHRFGWIAAPVPPKLSHVGGNLLPVGIHLSVCILAGTVEGSAFSGK